MDEGRQGQWQSFSANRQNIEGRLVLIDQRTYDAVSFIAARENLPMEVALVTLAGWGAGYWEHGLIPRILWDLARARQVDAARGRDAEG